MKHRPPTLNYYQRGSRRVKIDQKEQARQNVLNTYHDAPDGETERLKEPETLIYGVELKSHLVIWVDAASGEVIGLE